MVKESVSQELEGVFLPWLNRSNHDRGLFLHCFAGLFIIDIKNLTGGGWQ